MATNTQIPVADRRVPVIAPGHTFSTIGEKISNIVLSRPVSLGWIVGFLIVFGMMNLLMMCLGYLFIKGTGIWGIIFHRLGFAIVNFVWWIGIGHAGTLISAILCLLRQTWRNSINRFAEAMTLFAVACAGIFRSRTPDVRGLRIGSFRIRTPCVTGRISQSAGLGRVCGFDLWHDFAGVLVRRIDPRFCDLARQIGKRVGAAHLRIARHGMARFGPALAPL